MENNNELGHSRLDSLYVIADLAFDSAELALHDLEALLGLLKVPTEVAPSLVQTHSGASIGPEASSIHPD